MGFQQFVLRKCESGNHPRKIFRDVSAALSLDTIQRWVKLIDRTGAIELSISTS